MYVDRQLVMRLLTKNRPGFPLIWLHFAKSLFIIGCGMISVSILFYVLPPQSVFKLPLAASLIVLFGIWVFTIFRCSKILDYSHALWEREQLLCTTCGYPACRLDDDRDKLFECPECGASATCDNLLQSWNTVPHFRRMYRRFIAGEHK